MLVLRGHRNSVRSLAFSPDGRFLASAGDDARVHLWDGLTGELLHVRAEFRRPLQCLAFSPDSNILFAAGDEGVLHRIASRDGLLLDDLGRMDSGIVALALSPDGSWLAAGVDRMPARSSRPTLAVFDILEMAEAFSLDDLDLQRPVWSLAFAPDGHTLAVGRNDGQVVFAHLDRERGRRRIAGKLQTGVNVRAMAYAPHGRTLALSPSTPLLVYDVESRTIRHRLGEPRYAFESLAFCPGGTTLATGCQDSTVRFWDVQAGREIGRFDWQLGPIYAVAVSPDGMRAAAGGFTTEVILFDVDY